MPKSNDLYLLRNGVYTKVSPEHIIYISSFDNYCRFHLINGEIFVVRITLKSVARTLEKYHFLRCHRQYIINTQSVTSIDTINRRIFLMESHQVPYSRSKRKEIMKCIKLNN